MENEFVNVVEDDERDRVGEDGFTRFVVFVLAVVLAMSVESGSKVSQDINNYNSNIQAYKKETKPNANINNNNNNSEKYGVTSAFQR